MDGHCCNCGAELRTDLKRPTLNAIIRGRGVSSVDGLKSMGIVVSPGKERKYRICKICSQLIGKISQSKTEIEESHSSLQNISDGSTYLGQKIKRCLSPPASPPQKRRNLTQTPQQNTQETQTEPMAETPGDPPKKRKDTFLPQAAAYLAAGRYKQMMKKMKSSRSFNDVMINSVCQQINTEIKSNQSIFEINDTNKAKSYESFSWKKTNQRLKKNCPTMMKVLSAITDSRGPSKETNVRITMAASQLLYTRDPRKHKFIQELIGLLMWFAGTKRQIFERLSRLGLCTNIGTTTNCIDTLRGEFDTTIHHQKLQIADIKRRSTRAKKRLVPAEEWEDEGGWEEGVNIDDTTTTTFGFTLTFDNVSLWPSRTPFYSGQLNLVRSHAAIDRVSCFNLSDEAPSLKELSNISQDIFIPTTEDNDMLRYEYEVMIERILSKHIPCFKDIDVTEHIPHPYQAETKKKSVMVPLGVLQKDVTNVSDMIDVLEHLHKHVPGNKSPIPVILYGDQPSCERVRDAIGARSNEDTPWNRLGGLLPSIQESHKCLLFLEDTYKLLFDAKSVKSCGSLSFIKSRYKHTHVTPKVSYCFNYATSMLRFATEAHVVAAACEYMGISKPSDPPKDLPQDPKAKSVYFSEICKSVLDKSFHPYQPGHPAEEDEEELEAEEDEDEELGPFCICKQTREDVEMVFCHNKRCDRGKWFHLECLQFNFEELPEGKWFCSDKCRQQHQEERENKKKGKETNPDTRFEYSKAILHLGLGEMVRHDAVREGDGNRMIQHWRLDLVHFYEKHHWKYLIEGHNLIMDVNGGVSERVAHQLRWNRTENIHGGEGKNVGKDKDNKVSIDRAGGILNESNVSRYSQVVGMRKTINRKFDPKMTTGRMTMGRRKVVQKPEVQAGESDTANLAKLLVKHKCLVEIPGRSHQGFEDFEFEQKLNLNKYKAKMSAMSKRRVNKLKQQRNGTVS
eukprot:XP_011671233.1 PREDICTED: uncharacterized protein LOC752492 isoform X2 [Strongylocentrotus purpuratus]